MKILIANPAFRRPVGNNLERYFLGSGMRFPWSILKRQDERPRYAMFPFFLAYTAALLEKDCFDVKVIDCVPLNLSEKEFISRCLEINPDVLLFEPNTAVIDHVIRLSYDIKQQCGANIVLAGSHVSCYPEQILHDHSHIDFIAIGEYEQVFLRLMQSLRDQQSLDILPGIGHRLSDGTIQINERARQIEPLDKLPPPARHLFPSFFNHDMSLYHDGFCQYSPAFHMHASRGCPFECNFCVWVQVLYEGGKQRSFSAKRVVDEMQMLIDNQGAQEIYFDDDNFTSNRKQVYALCEEVKKRDLNIAWSAMADAIALTTDLLEEMASAGCIGIKFGLDSADINVLNSVQKPLKITHLETIIKKAKKLNIKTHMTVVFGLTGETKHTLNKTFDYSCLLDIDSIQFSIATPCPGTTMYNDLISKGRITAKRWDEFDGANTTVVEYSEFSQEYLNDFMAQSHSRWLRTKLKSPVWVLRQFIFLGRIIRGQGIIGIIKRFRRAIRLITGDAATIQCSGKTQTLRW
jgi:radical SAM superfamily enzyme YgiQ (UPF0313 family)